MKIDILTLFPEMFAPLEHSIVGKVREKGLLEINYHNFRENAEKSRHVDDEPYGGGQGMLLRAQPIFDAYDAIEKQIILRPRSRGIIELIAKSISRSFASARGLRPGDRLAVTMNGSRRSLRIVGLTQSPEFIYITAPGETSPFEGKRVSSCTGSIGDLESWRL